MVKKVIKSTYKEIELNLIDPPDGHVRMDIPERQLFELSESMKEIGLLQTILIRPVKERFEVIAGHRRYLAATRLHWKTITSHVKEMSDSEAAVARATENLQREGLSPIEEAAIYLDLAEKSNFTINMIADKVCKAASTIKRTMALLKLDTEVQKAIHSGQISLDVAFTLSKIGDKKELYRYLEIAIENGVTNKVAMGWTEDFRKSLQYVESPDAPAIPPEEMLVPQKYYTPCQICEGPIEYKDMHVIKVCGTCYHNIIQALKEGRSL